MASIQCVHCGDIFESDTLMSHLRVVVAKSSVSEIADLFWQISEMRSQL